MPVSQTQANVDLDADYGSGTPASIVWALVTATPSFTGAGTIVEPTSAQYAGYARVSQTNDVSHFAASSAGSKTNAQAITFPASTGGASSPVTVTHLVALSDATFPSAGRILDALPLPGGTTIAAGVALSFPPGSVTITES